MHIQQNQKGGNTVFESFLRHTPIGNKLHIEAYAPQRFCEDTGKVFIIFNDQSQLTHRFLHFSGFSAGMTSGSVTMNVVPISTLLFTRISPLIRLTNCLTMDNPSPNPPWTRVAPPSTWRKVSKI